MKVLHIFNSLQPSGAETMWTAAAEFLRARKVEIHVLATLPELGTYASEMRAKGFVVHHISHTRKAYFDFKYCRMLYKLIKENHFDAVQIHPEGWRFTNFVVARLGGVKRVTTTIHSFFMPRGLHAIRRFVMMNFIARCGGTIIAIGDSVLQNERRYLYPIRLIYNWIDVRKFARSRDFSIRIRIRKEFNIPPKAKLIILVGNCSTIKNHSFFFEMFANLPSDFYALHVGREDEATFQERHFADRLGISARVRFLGGRNDVGDLLEASDVFVMCSRLEGLGLSCLEALYKQIPAVVSDVPGLRDLSRLIPSCRTAPLDAVEFARAVVRAVEAMRQSGGKEGDAVVAKIEEQFSIEKNVLCYLRLWEGGRARKGDGKCA